jgi:outer membrane protein OmpA-like peptidoglycan-associated protein
LTSGRLDTTARIGIDSGKLDATADATLRELQVRAVPDTAAYRKLNQRLPVSLPVALSLLRGRDGDITLHLPISGDLGAPKVDFSSVLDTALTHALERSALVVFAPLGAALEIRELAGQLTSLRLRPVVFDIGKATLSKSSLDYLKRMASILEQRPDARVLLCGKATEAEAGAAPHPAGAQTLLRLAELRARVTKRFLVAHGVAAGRLYLCAPEIDASAGAEPRVEVSV